LWGAPFFSGLDLPIDSNITRRFSLPSPFSIPIFHDYLSCFPIAQLQMVNQNKIPVIPAKLETGTANFNPSIGIILTLHCHVSRFLRDRFCSVFR
jgi:hypothetical protein